ATFQPGIVTLSQPCADAAPSSAPGLRSRFARALAAAPALPATHARAQRAGRDTRAGITLGAADGTRRQGDDPGAQNVTAAEQELGGGARSSAVFELRPI